MVGLKGEYQALEQVSIQKKCTIPRLAPAPEPTNSDSSLQQTDSNQ